MKKLPIFPIIAMAFLFSPYFSEVKAQMKKSALSGATCTRLDKRAGQESTSPCHCSVGFKVYECKTCDENAECHLLYDLTPGRGGGRSPVIVWTGSGYAVFERAKKTFGDIKKYENKLFRLVYYKNQEDQKMIPVFEEIKTGKPGKKSSSKNGM